METSLLIAADRGIEAVPSAALSHGRQYFGDRFAFAITPSLALTDSEQKSSPYDRVLELSASNFKDFYDLPLVPQEPQDIEVQLVRPPIVGFGTSCWGGYAAVQDRAFAHLIHRALQ